MSGEGAPASNGLAKMVTGSFRRNPFPRRGGKHRRWEGEGPFLCGSHLTPAEVGGPHRGPAVAPVGAGGGPDADLAEPAVEDVAPVVGAVHPDLEGALGGAPGTGAPGDVLPVQAPVVAGASEPGAGAQAVLGCVAEVV